MKLYIKPVTGGATVYLDFEPTDTIADVKAKFQDTQGLNADQQAYYLEGGKKLEDDKTLSDYNIQNESVLLMVLTEKQNK